jgi:hypothetical protein
VLGFHQVPLAKTKHAGSDAYPGALHRFSASSIEDMNDSSVNRTFYIFFLAAFGRRKL